MLIQIRLIRILRCYDIVTHPKRMVIVGLSARLCLISTVTLHVTYELCILDKWLGRCTG